MPELYDQPLMMPAECPHPASEWSRLPLIAADSELQRGWECFICGWATTNDPDDEETDIAAEVQTDLAHVAQPTDLVRIRILDKDLPPFKHNSDGRWKSRAFAGHPVESLSANDAAIATEPSVRRIGSGFKPVAYDISIPRADLGDEHRPYTVVQNHTPRRAY
ncbi:hypothetical protein K388_07165 [Streptomyces sp. KhCrAH-43]|uniref:hypothetical protein n=1 Tax=unclassified Streptomyces TaxID=2593676 RepID=UPI0003824D7C|nr:MULTISPECIES: hypothetical protein [unclassified Streptomyces]MYS36367.1 hypothetical protein [Streptomyces sp. SID4920]MYX63930.1 hypothetical protein [Streptomyces sp. SID8373]RAJ47784.1 hypothetical protein K388_07165 [Streptomyces sp. KhCrAH-43]